MQYLFNEKQKHYQKMENLKTLSDCQIIAGVVNGKFNYKEMNKLDIQHILNVKFNFTNTHARLTHENWVINNKCKGKLFLRFQHAGCIECVHTNGKFYFNIKHGQGTGQIIAKHNSLYDAILHCTGNGWGFIKGSTDSYKNLYNN